VLFYTTRYDGVIKKFPSEWNFKRLKAGFIFKVVHNVSVALVLLSLFFVLWLRVVAVKRFASM
jgi:hypothetical protein